MPNNSSLKATSVIGLSAALLLFLVGCETNQSDATAGKTPQSAPAAPAGSLKTSTLADPVHILAGYGTDMTIQGVKWVDGSKFFADGSTIERPDITIETNANTGPAAIYKAERYAMTKFSYGPIPNGNYVVKLHFCETFEGITANGDRVFTYTVKGDGPPVKDFDVFATAGGALKPVVKTAPVSVTDHKIEIEFAPQVENPQINAIEILPGN